MHAYLEFGVAIGGRHASALLCSLVTSSLLCLRAVHLSIHHAFEFAQ